MTTTKNTKSEAITKSDSKQARRFAQKKNSEMNIVFLSGEANPLGIANSERRFWVVTGDCPTAKRCVLRTGATTEFWRTSWDK